MGLKMAEMGLGNIINDAYAGRGVTEKMDSKNEILISFQWLLTKRLQKKTVSQRRKNNDISQNCQSMSCLN